MLGPTPPASDHRPQDDALAEEAVPESADGSEVGRQTFRPGEDAHLAWQRGQKLAGHGPPTAPGWARERPRLENRRGQELLEAVAVAEREVAARGSAVAAEARALVEHQVGPARGRENRPRGLPAVGMAEELIPAWEHHGDTLALGEAQALVGRPLGPAVADRRLHAGRDCDRREEIGRGRADLERDAPAERLARDHDLPVPPRALRLDLLQHALSRAPIRIRALGEVVAVELEHVMSQKPYSSQ